ncbi:lipid A-modifier LpxR family protein [Massilia sp. TWP1-3-3]|uniref:lipid A-modifier LpxR family protein n=1 Tax=Massilia sp. TWP1-3-3 TaxID=2804573 RepID=UPI003CFB612A
MAIHVKNASRALVAALTAIFGGAAAQQAPPPQETVHFFTYENDSRFFTDRFYTSGVQFSVKHATDTRGDFARRLTTRLCGWTGCDPATVLTSQTNVGQLMYTPRNIRVAEAQPLDRPWAGLLYYEQAYAFLSPDQRTLTTFTGQIGVTGPASLAEPAQKAFHHLLDRPQPQGWDHQLGGSLGVLVSAEKRTGRESLSFDLPAHVRFNTATYWRVTAGNIQTYAAAGVAVVIGKDLPPVSPPPPGIGNKIAGATERKASALTSCMVPWIQCTTFGSVEARAVGYNVFLDGRLFHDNDPSLERRPFLYEVVFGTRFDFPGTRTASHGPWFAQVKVTQRSPEFRSPLGVPSHKVSALTIGTEF